MARLPQPVIQAIRAVAMQYGIPTPNLLAVVAVESGGVVSARVVDENGVVRQEPLLRWEGHYFDKRLTGNQRIAARTAGLAHPTAQKIKNPAKQQDRWNRLFWPGYQLNPQAAIESCSWGVGQVMGAHWDKLGFDSAQQFLDHCRAGVGGQVDVMVRYCKAFGLMDELQRGDFQGFARGYNGPNFRKFNYDGQMRDQAAYWATHEELEPDAPTPVTVGGVATVNPRRTRAASSMVRMGTEGARVREAQSLLQRAGYAVKTDGDFGPSTKDAVLRFQAQHQLEQDGIIGPKTWQALEQHKVSPEEKPGIPSPTEAIVQTPQGREGMAGVGAGATIAVAKEMVQDAITKLDGITGQGNVILDTIGTGLTVVSALLVLGGVAWTAWGWYRANTTRGVAA